MSKQPTEQTARDIKSLLEIELGNKVSSTINICVTDDRNVVVMMTGSLPDMVTMLGACLYNLHKQLTEKKVIPKMNYFKFIVWFYKQSLDMAKAHHVKNTQAKSKASEASGKSSGDVKPS